MLSLPPIGATSFHLKNRFSQTEQYCALSDRNGGSSSIDNLALLLAVCGEIDVLGKEIMRQVSPDVSVGQCTISKWGYRLCCAFPGLGHMSVQFSRQWCFKPFEKWEIVVKESKGKARYELAEGARPLQWWNDYNDVKHHRAEINKLSGASNFEKANQRNLVHAFGALFLLNRLFMKTIDPEDYATLRRSSLFMVCNSSDEARGYFAYDSEGYPAVYSVDPSSSAVG